MARSRIGKLTLALGLGTALAGCQADQPFAFLKHKPADAATSDATTGSAATGGAATADGAAAPAEESSVKLVDRDVEAPDVYQASDKALWDGRPSLGGVWVAATNVTDPQRVIIRNPKNGKFVIGALFRREQLNPGPKLQLSSDAAEALGMLAGQPAMVSVTALKRVETPAPAPNPNKPALDTNEAIQSKPIAEISASAGAAIDKAAGKPGAKPQTTASTAAGAAAKGGTAGKAPPPAPTAAVASSVPAAGGDRAYAQIGIFSVEANATRAAKLMKSKGLSAAVVKEESHDKTFWRVLIGPTAASGREALLAKVKALGFADAYFVNR